MCDPVTIALIGTAISGLGVANSYMQGQKAQKQQKQASQQAQANADKTFKQQDQAMNRANQKAPNIAALMSANQKDSTLGNTNLSGIGGVKPSELQLGKNSLLGS